MKMCEVPLIPNRSLIQSLLLTGHERWMTSDPPQTIPDHMPSSWRVPWGTTLTKHSVPISMSTRARKGFFYGWETHYFCRTSDTIPHNKNKYRVHVHSTPTHSQQKKVSPGNKDNQMFNKFFIEKRNVNPLSISMPAVAHSLKKEKKRGRDRGDIITQIWPLYQNMLYSLLNCLHGWWFPTM